MMFLVAGFLVMLGALSAIAAAPMIFSIIVTAAQVILAIIVVLLIAFALWLRRQ